MSISSKIDKLTDAQIRQIAAESGRSYLDVVRDLQALKKQSEYWKSPAAKRAAKRYRDKRRARLNSLKDLL